MAPLFLATYAAAGGDAAAVARAHGLPEAAASMREVDLSTGALDAVANAAAERTGDPNLGLHLGIRLPHGSYGLLEYIGRSAATVRRAGERFIRYSALLNDTVTFSFAERGGAAVLSQRVEGRPSCVGRHAGEMFVVLVVRYLRELTDPSWKPLRIGFAHAAPRDTREHEAWFGAPLAFDRGENRVELPLAMLESPVVSRDEALFSLLDAQAAREIAARPSKTDLGSRVRAEVRRALEDGQPQVARVARALATSPRTLQRRLGEEGTSFQSVVDGVREELARVYIADRKLALGEVAYLLGFSEISAFTRAFKRWTGTTPSRWRDRSNDPA
jgi:AraC-like DNA-binding protein